jgi:prolyl-tRNA editing enzyme YbaK/EbsC (Cys-tRNA(Pro) deacylase)
LIKLSNHGSQITKILSPSFSARKSVDVAPGTYLSPFTLDHTVVSCKQAAAAKHIQLTNELKTLILDTSIGIIAVHLRGDTRLSLRKVKRCLSCKNASIASKKQIGSLGLTRGAISAVLEPVWSMPNLVSENILTLDYVSTNNGTHDQYFKFCPQILIYAPNVHVGEFDALALNQ